MFCKFLPINNQYSCKNTREKFGTYCIDLTAKKEEGRRDGFLGPIHQHKREPRESRPRSRQI